LEKNTHFSQQYLLYSYYYFLKSNIDRVYIYRINVINEKYCWQIHLI
jgi:hypothetical protein